jgi:hypothetical protein
MIPKNTEIVRYDCLTYASQVHPVWLESVRRSDFENYGEKIYDEIKIFVNGQPEFKIGDFISVGANPYPLSPDTLEDFIADFAHYKAEKVKIMRLPGGTVHHLEITAKRYAI